MARTESSIIATLGATLALSGFGDVNTFGIQISSVWAGTIVFEATIDGTNWTPIYGMPVGGFIPVKQTTSNGAWQFGGCGIVGIRARATAWTSGTASVFARAAGQGEISLGVTSGPGVGGGAVTKSDSAPDPIGPFRGLFITTLGDVSFLTTDGDTIALTSVPAFTKLDEWTVQRVNATGTSLTGSQVLGIK